jgi:hypothetical protein
MTMSGHDPKEPLPESWQGRKFVTAALWDLVADFESRSETWENTTVPDYLEALCALLMSIEHSYANNGRDLPTDPWIVMADALKGARFYE